jgi:hypothetical protein
MMNFQVAPDHSVRLPYNHTYGGSNQVGNLCAIGDIRNTGGQVPLILRPEAAMGTNESFHMEFIYDKNGGYAGVLYLTDNPLVITTMINEQLFPPFTIHSSEHKICAGFVSNLERFWCS